MIVALLASLIGILLTAGISGIRLNLGDAFLLDAYAAVFLGAAVFRPGQFSIPGTLVGALFLRVIEVGLLALQISNAWINIAKGRDPDLRRAGQPDHAAPQVAVPKA